ncbi:MAG: hypothetical protein R2939_10735 [Kofleriaceae bacterium]
MTVARDPAPTARRAILVAALAGAIGGAGAGLVDGLWSWGGAAQYAPGVLGRLRWLCYLGAAYALLGAAASAGLATVLHLGRGALWLRWVGDHAREVRAAGSPRAVVGLSLALTVPPVLAAGVWVTHARLAVGLATRKDFSLVVMTSMLAALGVVLGGLVLALVVARVVEAALAVLARRGPAWLGRSLRSPRAPGLVRSWPGSSVAPLRRRAGPRPARCRCARRWPPAWCWCSPPAPRRPRAAW